MSEKLVEEIKNAIKCYPDFPIKGIVFRDCLPILQSPEKFENLLTVFEGYIKERSFSPHCIAGIEARGFLIGPTLALRLKIPFVPIRKPGKLPGEIKKETYVLEYGTDALEIQTSALEEGQNVIIVDDLVATGGSMAAAVKLIQNIGGNVECCFSIIELSDLKGRDKIAANVYSVIQY